MHLKRFLCLMILSALPALNGCSLTSPVTEKQAPAKVKIRPKLWGEDLPTVMFDIKSVTTPHALPGLTVYDCVYQAGGKTAKFRLQFKETRTTEGEFPVAVGEGKFLAVAGSDNTILLRDLKKALDAKNIPRSSSRMKELSFDAAVLGKDQSRDSSGSFSDKPKGDWIAIKIFLPKGGDDGEVFLNLNPRTGQGEFSIKDSDYGDYLLKEFAKVL